MDSTNQDLSKSAQDVDSPSSHLQHRVALQGLIYNNAPVMLFVTDQNGEIIDVNAYWLDCLGYVRTEVIGKSIVDFLVEDSRGYAKLYELPKFLENGVVRDIPYQILTKSGKAISVMISSVLEHDEAGNQISISVMHDITEINMFKKDIIDIHEILQQRQLELEALNKELESFSYSVSHDLRSPLRSIDGFSLLLLENCGTELSAQGLEYLTRIRSSTQRMGELIEDLLKLSHLSRIEIQKEDVNLSKLVESIILVLQQQNPQRHVEVTLSPDLIVFGDARLLQVALENLLSNAWKFSSKVDLAKIEFGQVSLEGGKNAYFIKDNGAGFNLAYADKMFGAFQRMHKASEFPGTGVGLATVQRVINRHGGKIWADSSVGKGAVFYFTL